MDAFLPRTEIPRLFAALVEAGYRVLAPTVEQDAIKFAEVDSIVPLQGLRVEQGPGRYRLSRTDDAFCFSWAVGPEAIKPMTFCSSEPLWRSSEADGLSFEPIVPTVQPTAVIGARACDLAAFSLQQQHFQKPPLEDAWFGQRAGALFIVAVDCGVSAETCFCHSTGDGPAVEQGFDLRLHELTDGFLLAAGSEQGNKILAQLPAQPASEQQQEQQERQLQSAIDQQQRSLPAGDLNDALRAKWDAPAWQRVAERCLSCANCTSVCPTCFCHQQRDLVETPGQYQHVREWGSCFTEQHSYIHGIVIRADTRSRYRQWLTHKLGTWHEQYGRSGCVGCGRCITWCPVGIDITESVRQVLEDEA